ncbi:hypothetical protein GP486_003036 [Trichoglossum hirsutum]|uniref:PXA domain-containing protein n=1 Tax=Trichoglossum hirsutum TaxID=265104 RepID=A0A9P8LDT8_9PEZI|nr:hypothetical protein GP486_003036 [Trichoglossum hirsutum]
MASDSNVGGAIEATSIELPSGDEGARTPTTPTGSDENVQPQQELGLTSTPAQGLTSHLLNFLSNASNEKLGACLVGLGAATYFVFGRIGLVLIGIVVGVALHATWEGNSGDEAAKARETRRRREVALDVVERVLDWRDKRRGDSDSTKLGVELNAGATKPLDFSGFGPETAAALSGLADAVIRDYVKYTIPENVFPLIIYLNYAYRWWYTPILPSEQSFPDTCRQTLTAFIISVSSHLSRKRPADTFLEFVTNSSSIVIVFLNELSNMLSATSSFQMSPAELVSNYIENNPDSSLANVVDARQQQKKLEMVAEDILQHFLEPKAYDCQPVRIFLREILAGVVLEMSIKSCSKPEFINEWIVYLLEGGEPEIMNVIDAGVGRATGGGDDIADSRSAVEKGHLRRLSKAEEAMEEAMMEARRLSQLIAEEEAKKNKSEQSSSFESAGTGLSENQESPSLVSPLKTVSDAITDPSYPRSAPLELASVSQADPLQLAESNSISDSPTPSSFTSFDQIVPAHRPTALHTQQTNSIPKPEPLPTTLYNANISIFDDSDPSDKSVLRNKPSVDYLIQIEPALSAQLGWMIVRKYADFETLHEVLRRISKVAGVQAFVLEHSELPSWRGQTRSAVRSALEKYLTDSLRYRPLAESEGMKRFLEKEQASGSGLPAAGGKGGFPGIGWPNPAAFETMGKGMLDVLSSAPKGAAEGGKALFGGVSGVLGGVTSLGHKKSTPGPNVTATGKSRSSSSISLPRTDIMLSESSGCSKSRESQESCGNELPAVQQLAKTPLVENHPRTADPGPDRNNRFAVPARTPPSPEAPLNGKPGKGPSTGQAALETPLSSQISETDGILDLSHLPPPPSDIQDDYDSPAQTPKSSRSRENLSTSRLSDSTTTTTLSGPSPTLTPAPSTTSTDVNTSAPSRPQRTPATPLTEEETQIAVELLFAIINELYTLSSAWNIRRTLLTAAKTFLLRPGNPNLEAIRQLLQGSVIDANTSDPGIAFHIRKLRENCLPTEEELGKWPAEMTEEEKGRLMGRARKLLVERGMPKALESVMGTAASREALGKVFDCLQVQEIRRSVVFGLLLQGVRAVTQ